MSLFSKKLDTLTHAQPNSTKRYGLLIVDDEILNLTSLAGLLEDDYFIITANSAAEALKVLSDESVQSSIQVVVSDQRMPQMTGVEFLAKTRDINPNLKRILLTGYTDVDAIIDAINDAAIYKYVRKPVDSHDLRMTLKRATEVWQLEHDHRSLLEEQRLMLERITLLDTDKLEFLRYLSHEMNTPLNWLAATQILDPHTLSDEAREVIEFVDQGRERLHALVESVLRYFHLVGLRYSPALGLVDVPLLIQQKLDELSGTYGTTQLIKQLPETLTLPTDPQLLTEALSHLIENAFTHAHKHPAPEITIQVRQDAEQCMILISNSGATLPPENLHELIKPFRFGSDHSEGGFGISLATVKAAALILGGDLTASTGLNASGVCLQLTLPKKEVYG